MVLCLQEWVSESNQANFEGGRQDTWQQKVQEEWVRESKEGNNRRGRTDVYEDELRVARGDWEVFQRYDELAQDQTR